MKRNAILLGFLLLLAGAKARAMAITQCTVLGCTDGEVRISDWSGEWVFEYLEKFYLTNPLLDEMTRFLRKTHRLGPHDRVDYLRFELSKQDCQQGREIGSFVCHGKAGYGTWARVRKNERYIEGKGGHDFTWKNLGPREDRPWTIDLRKLVSAGSTELLMSISDGIEHQDFWRAPLGDCRNNEL